MTRRSRRTRAAGRLVAGLGAATFVALTISGTSPASFAGASATTTSTVPSTSGIAQVSLDGVGSYDVGAELNQWEDALYGKKGNLQLSYVQLGSEQGRASLLDGGTSDFTISGVPYSQSELTAAKTSASDIIAAPIMPDAVGMLLDPPLVGNTAGLDSIDDNSGNATVYTGPVRVPSENLAAMELNYNLTDEANPVYPTGSKDDYDVPGLSATPYGDWYNPNIVQTWDANFLKHYTPDSSTDPSTFSPFDAGPTNVQQAEANEQSYYLEEWAADAAPTVWSGLGQAFDPDYTVDPSSWAPSEQLQATLPVTTEGGLGEDLQTIEDGGLGPNGNTTGVVGSVPASGLDQALAYQASLLATCKREQKTNPSLTCDPPPAGENYEWMSVQNAAGDWETPTATSIDAGVDAAPAPAPTATTGVTPLWGTTNQIPGAYPLTYVDYLYAPAKGLSIDQTEALATMIRYLVTDGQSALTANGDGTLSPTLVKQALASANQLVTSDCTAAKGKIVTLDSAGPYAPDTPKLQALAPQEHCETPPAPVTTTTTTAPSTTTTTTPSTTSTTVATTPTTPYVPGASVIPPSSSGSTPPGSGSSTATTTPTTTRRGAGAGTGKKPTGGKKTRQAHPAVRIEAETASALPYGTSTNTTGGLDKLAALAIGAGGFLLLRRRAVGLVRRLFGA